MNAFQPLPRVFLDGDDVLIDKLTPARLESCFIPSPFFGGLAVEATHPARSAPPVRGLTTRIQHGITCTKSVLKVGWPATLRRPGTLSGRVVTGDVAQ